MRRPLRRIRGVLVIAMLLLPLVGGRLAAQDGGGEQIPPAAGSLYDYSGLGGIPMQVNVWGFVRKPGRYIVPASMKLVELLSLAGGTTEHAFIDRIRVVRDLTVDSSLSQAVVVYDIGHYLQSGDTALNPILYPSSTVIVDGESDPTSFSDVLAVIGSVATITLSIVGIFVAINN